MSWDWNLWGICMQIFLFVLSNLCAHVQTHWSHTHMHTVEQRSVYMCTIMVPALTSVRVYFSLHWLGCIPVIHYALQVARAVDYLNRPQTLPVHCARLYEVLPDDPQYDGITYESVKHLIEAKPPKKVRSMLLNCPLIIKINIQGELLVCHSRYKTRVKSEVHVTVPLVLQSDSCFGPSKIIRGPILLCATLSDSILFFVHDRFCVHWIVCWAEPQRGLS